MRRRRSAAVLLGIGVLFVTAAGMPVADCEIPPPLPEAIDAADAVFVGVVERLTNGDRWAQVRVDEVWKGDVSVPRIEVQGGMNAQFASTVDRTYVLGMRYLFVLPLHEGRLVDGACTSTTEWNESMAELRPATAVSTTRPAEESESSGLAGLTLSLIVALGLGGAAVGIIGLVLRRQSDG